MRTRGETSKLQGRCAICPRSKDRKTKYMCQKCKKFLCLQRVIPPCEECVPETEISD